MGGGDVIVQTLEIDKVQVIKRRLDFDFDCPFYSTSVVVGLYVAEIGKKVHVRVCSTTGDEWDPAKRPRTCQDHILEGAKLVPPLVQP
jgi:hypothetical protein